MVRMSIRENNQYIPVKSDTCDKKVEHQLWNFSFTYTCISLIVLYLATHFWLLTINAWRQRLNIIFFFWFISLGNFLHEHLHLRCANFAKLSIKLAHYNHRENWSGCWTVETTKVDSGNHRTNSELNLPPYVPHPPSIRLWNRDVMRFQKEGGRLILP